MNISELTELCKRLDCNIKEECLLSEYITFKFGGACRALIDINSAEAASELLKYIKKNNMKYAVLGKGSNVLVKDEGFDGIILHFGNDFADIRTENLTIKAQAGAMLSAVCKKAQESGLSGMENLFGIPGTVGGALYMNAGAYGSEMRDVVKSAEYIDENGNIRTIFADDMNLSYRHSIFAERKCIITSVEIELKKGEAGEIKSAMHECMQKRVSKQPWKTDAKTEQEYYAGDFFGAKAGLTVSGQLEGEYSALGLGRIYTFGPTFRA